MIRACDICGNSADYANKHHDAGHGFTYAAQEVRPADVRKGDRVRITSVTEGVVGKRNDDWIFVDGIAFDPSMNPDESTDRTWELIERPKPEAKLGSVWVDPDSKIEYVALRHGLFIESGGGGSVREPWSAFDAEVVARLVPTEEQA